MTQLGFLWLTFLTIPVMSQNQTFVVSDLTKENLFSRNIEGPNFHDGILYVVNFQRDGTVGAVKPNGEVELYVELPDGSIANAIQLDKKENMFLADFKGHNILKVDKKTKKISVFAHNDQFNQPNDICINKKGQIFASDPNWKEQTGKLWRIDDNGSVHLLRDNMGTTNGITLSPDELTLYVNESAQRKIWKFSIDKNGGLQDQTLFAEFTDFGLDGMKCDSKGNLYVTRYGKGVINIYAPDGKLLREVFTKGKNTSNLNFGGKDKKTVFVTLQDRKCVEFFIVDTPGK